MAVSESACASFVARHLTIRGQIGQPVPDAARHVFTELATSLAAFGIAPLQEKVYGPLAERDTILGIRSEVLSRHGLDGELPVTFIAGRRDEDLGVVGTQLLGVVPATESPLRVRTVHYGAGFSGRLLECKEGRLLHLAAVDGSAASGLRAGTVSAEAEQMLKNAERGLIEHGFGFRHVVRTWIYLARLLDWYGEFNRIRTAFLRERGITGAATGAPYPASTGIQGCQGAGECFMDLLAVDGPGFAVRPIQASSRQKQPIAYGSSFSRGMALCVGGEQTVFVSGTASIDGVGQTLHCWQREAQVLETLLGLAGLLEDQGASLRDVALATIFCKDRETFATFERLTRQLGITRMPVLPVLADVCRPELMVEIEALALVPSPSGLQRWDSSSARQAEAKR